MKTNKIIFWIATGLLSAMMLMSAGMYVFNNAEIQPVFVGLGFPTWVMYPLAFLKVSGVLVITISKWKTVKEWAYAGFFFDFLLAIGAHVSIGDGEQFGAIIALTLLIVSYVFRKRLA
ncbi:DoxX family protein [Flavicella sp.]|uniref:DoxX family protein n=1 Tax=Flavicella sp. TaxID=2957742 RepID=UPI0026331FB1|nr:DoxX family protein [Flavicella sp.]MDG1806136.1 DoxX family protein [Flavicella sp.]MDG2280593.1 DoxX family protein [Flavicella sp.]